MLEHKDRSVPQVLQDPKVYRDLMDSVVLVDLLAHQDPKEHLDRQEDLAMLDPLAHLDLLGHQDLKAGKEKMERLDPQDFL